MGILNNGPHGPVTGRVDNLVYYVLNGKNVVRKIGRTTKPPTEAQLNARKITKLSSEFFSLLLDFINVGFGIAARGTDKSPFNLVVKENKKRMFKGVFPDLEIDYSQLVISQGTLKAGKGFEVASTPEAINFSWEANPMMPWEESTDQVMMLAYFPFEERVIFKIFGNNRVTGADQLDLPESLGDKYAETYVAFISADRTKVSDSTYTGSINLTT